MLLTLFALRFETPVKPTSPPSSLMEKPAFIAMLTVTWFVPVSAIVTVPTDPEIPRLLFVRLKETEDAQADGTKTAKIRGRDMEHIFRRSGILFTTLPTPFAHGLRVVRCQRHPVCLLWAPTPPPPTPQTPWCG